MAADWSANIAGGAGRHHPAMNSKATSAHPTNIKYRATGTACRSCKLSNVGSPKTATHRRKCDASDAPLRRFD
jgi:hypothetical protein